MGKAYAVSAARTADHPVSLSDLTESVARQLVNVRHDAGGAYFRVPLLYPSGSSVVIRVEQAGSNFLVSDFGLGQEEAEMLGGGNIFSRHASDIAAAAGVDFDSSAFFVMRVSSKQLAGAIATIANCSKEAVDLTVLKLSELKNNDAADALYDRLVRVFSAQRVVRNASLLGQSTTKWKVTALVHGKSRDAIFEPVSPHHASVFAAATKFHDLAASDRAPSRIAVVESAAAFNTYLGVLSQSANVIEGKASDEVYQELADAA